MEHALTPMRNCLPVRSRLTEERQRHVWSQQELADLLGTTPNTVSRWELGKTTPRPYFVKKLCAIFDKSLQELDLLPSAMDEKQYADPPTVLASSPTLNRTRDQSAHLQHPFSARKNHVIKHKDDLYQVKRSLLSEEDCDATGSHQVLQPQSQMSRGRDEMGKTQILAEYIYRAHGQGRTTYTFWTTAVSVEAIIASFKMLTELLSSFPAQEEENKQEPCQRMAAITSWLECSPQRWLLIFDTTDEDAPF